MRPIFFLMENNNDIQEVRHTPRGFSGYYIQKSCFKSFAERGWNIYAQTSPFTLLLIARRFWLGDSLPPSKNKNENTVAMLWGCFSGSRNLSEVVWWLQSCSTATWTFLVNKCVSNNFTTKEISDCLLVWEERGRKGSKDKCISQPGIRRYCTHSTGLNNIKKNMAAS